ncbi:MAG: sulfatase-modifying factor protein [Gammaproteobacteria bacterium]|jgi:iron(II)-dependent oxidoreductase|nr:sulfatase-modifying factor protein [Gammaproteobacteria bacterium]
MNSSPIRTTTDYKFSHALTGPYLPPPGKVPGWPFTAIGHWMIDVNGAAENWVRGLREWRQEHLIRIGFDDSIYRRTELLWAQRNFVHTLLMVEDRNFYDANSGRYTVDRYLDDLESRFGGIDSVLIWYVYPNIGVDDRNQFDLIHDLPGGLDGLRGVVSDFHRRGVKVFLPTTPWDNGTRAAGRPHWEIMAEHVKVVGADGINGDTYSGLPRAFFDACDAVGHPVVVQPESTAQAGDHILTWNVQSWTKKIPQDVIPIVPKLKWLEPRHIITIENRWSRDRNNDLQHAFFNGIGYNAWENVWGIWNQLTPRDAETLRRVAMIQRQFAPLLVSADWTPYEKTLQAGVFASRFPGTGSTLWTLVNRNEYHVDGDQIAIEHVPDTAYFDVWNGQRIEPRFDSVRAVCAMTLEGHGFGAILAVVPGAQSQDLDRFLERVRELARAPLRSFSAEWKSLPQEIMRVERTRRVAQASEGMIRIPPAEFDFAVQGVEIEGQTWEGLDVQYPWETSPRRSHRRRLSIEAFCIDRYPVTNAQYKAFLDATAYRPQDDHNFLRHWHNGRPHAGWDNKPVTWVSIEDARAYAQWAGKRLPHEWEWQYAAQGGDDRRYPWGNEWNPEAVPEPAYGRAMPAPDDVNAHPAGASPFGVMDLVGNVWQWTDEYADAHTRAAILRGGSAYQPQTSHWYFPQAYRLDQHGKYLLMAPCKDRSAGIGFRCVIDA